MNKKIGSQVNLLKRCCLNFQFELCPFMKRCCLDFHFELCLQDGDCPESHQEVYKYLGSLSF